MKRGHVTSIYYYFNIVKMAASTVQMANNDDAGNPVTISPPVGPNQFPPVFS